MKMPVFATFTHEAFDFGCQQGVCLCIQPGATPLWRYATRIRGVNLPPETRQIMEDHLLHWFWRKIGAA